MRKKIFCVLLVLSLGLASISVPLSAASPAEPSAKTYFYDQLTEGGQQVYDALLTPEALSALKAGENVIVDSHTVTIPSDVNQAQFDALVGELNTEKERLATLMHYATDAAAALDRDRSEIFWTNGIYARVSFAIDGEVQTGNLSITPGKSYTVLLLVSLPIVEDWDGDGLYDRDLAADIETLSNAVKTVADGARTVSSARYDQLRYVNDLLCRINQYHTEAANADPYPQYYPWTALSALSPLDTENDASEGALKPVCEGYARATKLICDALDIPCILVSGKGNGENHMWNYVRLEDGNWYGLDVTWNDTAKTDQYFLRGADFFAKSHTSAGVFIPGEQTVTFTYPTLAADDYVVPTTAVGISVSELPLLVEGYPAASLALTFTNYGTLPTQLTSVSLSESEAMTLEGTLSTETLASGAFDTSVCVQIADGLSAGTYTATLTLVYGDGLEVTQTLTVTVKEKPTVLPPEDSTPRDDYEIPNGESADKKDEAADITDTETAITLPAESHADRTNISDGCGLALSPAACLLLALVAPATVLWRRRED